MLKRDERLKYSGLFQQAYATGKKLSSKHLRIVFTKSLTRLEHKLPLVGFSISKDFSKSAVKRNRIKRQIREIYRLFRQSQNNAEKLKSLGLLVVTLHKSTRADTLSLDYANLKKEFESLLLKI